MKARSIAAIVARHSGAAFDKQPAEWVSSAAIIPLRSLRGGTVDDAAPAAAPNDAPHSSTTRHFAHLVVAGA